MQESCIRCTRLVVRRRTFETNDPSASPLRGIVVMKVASQWTAIGVYPDFTAVDAAYGLGRAVGALLTVVLVLAVLMLIVCAVAAAIAEVAGNPQAARKARAGAWAALAAAMLAGAAVTLTRFLLGLGTQL